MTDSRVNHFEAKAKDILDKWECRYFVSELPIRFTHNELKKVFDESDPPSIENDLYFFIADDKNMNIKLRKLTEPKPTIKVKMLRDNNGEFELWHTEIDDELPAPAEVWRKVLARLKVEDNIKRFIKHLSRCEEPYQVEEILLNACSNIQRMEAWKLRRFYGTPAAKVEVVVVDIGSHLFYSVSFESESPDSAQARAIRDKLSADELGTPKSYVSFLKYL